MSDRRRPAASAPNSTALAHPPSPLEPWRDPEWQGLWLSVQSRPWTSLALIPAGEGATEDFTVLVAVILSRTGMVHLGSPIQVADGTRVPLAQLAPFMEEVKRYTAGGERILIALPPAVKSPVTHAIAQASDAALLCVLLGSMASAQARKTVSQVGAQRFLGSAIFHPHQIAQARAKR